MKVDQYSIEDLLLKRRRLFRELSQVEGLRPVRIAVLGGSTTQELVDLLELLLLEAGFRPEFYQSEYGRYYEDAVIDSGALVDFAPEIVYLHTSVRNIQGVPPVAAAPEELRESLAAEMSRWRQIWDALEAKLPAQIIQNNFELPLNASMGNLDAITGAGRFVLELNAALAGAAQQDARLIVQDVHGISSRMGLQRWFDRERWFACKIHITPEAGVALARSLTAIVRAIYGRTYKVLALDLDNTLWGGVIGDEGVEGISIGRETPLAEAYTAFQEYCLALRQRGILLAVCSKNDEGTARQGFEHPDSVLKLGDFACFKANWQPKHENLQAIASELNVGVDSIVFVDDNPAERAIVEAQLPGVAVPDVGADVTYFADAIERARYFETIAISREDMSRAALYQANSGRAEAQAKFADYSEYLDWLEMTAEIAPFKPVYMARIAQLTNRTNQFNLTTRRYTQAEIEAMARDPRYIGLYGRLTDRFGDNGLISLVLGRREDDVLHLDLWLMSCRVLKREMELAMLDALVERARAAGMRTLRGYYIPTKKNTLAAEHYLRMGFTNTALDAETGMTTWDLSISGYTSRSRHIRVLDPVVL